MYVFVRSSNGLNKTAAYRYIVFFFRTEFFSGELKSSSEGEVFWIDKFDLLSYPLTKDFEEMFRVFDSDPLSENYYFTDDDGNWHFKNL